MIAEVATIDAEQTLTLEQRRAFHRLPLAERRRILAIQAERAASYYEDADANLEEIVLAVSDIIECP